MSETNRKGKMAQPMQPPHPSPNSPLPRFHTKLTANRVVIIMIANTTKASIVSFPRSCIRFLDNSYLNSKNTTIDINLISTIGHGFPSLCNCAKEAGNSTAICLDHSLSKTS